MCRCECMHRCNKSAKVNGEHAKEGALTLVYVKTATLVERKFLITSNSMAQGERAADRK